MQFVLWSWLFTLPHDILTTPSLRSQNDISLIRSELSRHFSSFPTSLTIESPHLSRLLPWLPLPLSLIHSTCWYISLARTHCSHLPQFWLCSIRIFLIHTNNLRSLLKKILWYFSCLLYCLYSRFIINLLIILSVKFEFAFFILKCNMSYHFT